MTATRSRARAWPASAGTDAGALVASAARLRWRAPELTLLLADRASSAAARAGEESARLRAEVLAVFACNQLGRGASAGGRAVRALRAAQAAGAQVTERLVRVELAACAADASAPAVALALLQPVLTSKRRVAPTARAAALVAAADGLAKLGGGPEVAGLLTAADRLYDASRAVEPDAVLLRRGVVHGRLAAHHRRIGDHAAAEEIARRGLSLLNELSDNQLETGQVSGALTFELVLALLELGREAEAVLAAQSLLRRSVRPAGASAASWLRLALASRVHVPAGRYPLARRLLGDAAFTAERHQLDAVLAECRQLEAQLHERCDELTEALECLRGAQLAERRWRACTAELRTLLAAEFGVPPPAAELRAELAAAVAELPLPGAAAGERPARLAASDPRPATLGRPLTPSERTTAIRRRVAGRHSVLDHERAPVEAPQPAATSVQADLAQPSPAAEPQRTQAPDSPWAPGGAPPDRQWASTAEPRRDHRWATPVDPADGQRLPSPPGRPAWAADEPPRDQQRGRTAEPPGESGATPAFGTTQDPSGEFAADPQRATGVGPPVAEWSSRPLRGIDAAPTEDQVPAVPPPGAEDSASPSEPTVPTGREPSTESAAPPAPVVEPSESWQLTETPTPVNGLPAAAPRVEPSTPVLGIEQVPSPRAPVAGRRGDRDANTGSTNGTVDRWSDTAADRRSEAEPRDQAVVPEQARPADADGTPTGDQETERADSETDRGSGRHRSDVALADLLAEALVAYENGRRSHMAEAVPERPFGSPVQPEQRPEQRPERQPEPRPEPRFEPRPAFDDQPEPDPSVTQPTGVPVQPAFADYLRPTNYAHAEIPRPRLIDLPRDEVWREPGTF